MGVSTAGSDWAKQRNGTMMVRVWWASDLALRGARRLLRIPLRLDEGAGLRLEMLDHRALLPNDQPNRRTRDHDLLKPAHQPDPK